MLWTDSGQGQIVGRNMDWTRELETALWVMPRGPERGGGTGDPNPLSWRARYGSVVTTAAGTTATDGINERGLGAHLLWFTDSDYGVRDPQLPAVTTATWAQHALDCFDTVEAVAQSLQEQPFQVRALRDPFSGERLTAYLAVEDAAGDSAVIEYVGGEAVVHRGPETRVATNSPAFDRQLERLSGYEGFGGEQPLPGTTDAADRFVRATYYTQRLPKADNPQHAYAELLSVMRNAAQPFNAGDPRHPDVPATVTLWRSLADLGRGIYAYESSLRPDPVWVHLEALNLDRYERLDLSGPDLHGEVAPRFEPTSEFAFPPFEG